MSILIGFISLFFFVESIMIAMGVLSFDTKNSVADRCHVALRVLALGFTMVQALGATC